MMNNSTKSASKFHRTCRSKLITGLDKIQVTLANSLFDIPIKEWNAIIGEHHQFINPTYLEAIQKAHSDSLEVRYCMFYLESKPIGVAAFQITHFKTNSDSYQNGFMRFVAKASDWLRAGHVHNILIAGNAFATGEHGFCFVRDISPTQQAAAIVAAMDMIAVEERGNGKQICAMLIKDFYSMSSALCEAFNPYGFSDFKVDHNMIMPIDLQWNSYDDYLKILNTKFRTKAKGAYKKSQALTIQKPTAQWLLENRDRIHELYEAVHEKADFRLGKLDLDVLSELLRVNWNDFELRTYHLGEVCVGFMTAVICGDRCEAHIVGIDYEHNRDHGVYQRMLYDYVQVAIDRHCKYLVFGRTAAEIKSTVGAFPVDLTVLIRHRKRISNALLSLILNYVKPSGFPQRQPYQVEYAKALNGQFHGLLDDCNRLILTEQLQEA